MSKKYPNRPKSGSPGRASSAEQHKESAEVAVGELRPVPETKPLERIAGQYLPGTGPIAARRTVTRTEKFNGPIPHPDIFRKYGEVIPDAPERILRVFEADSQHVREITMSALVAQRADNKRIHWMAFGLIAGGYAMSGLFAYFNKDVLAGIVLSTTIVGTVVGFLQQRSSAAADDDEPKGKSGEE